MSKLYLDIPGSQDWEIVEPITKGWSGDLKYFVRTFEGQKLLLRLSDKSSLESERQVYHSLAALSPIDIISSKLLDSGLCNDQQHTYRLFTWVEGQAAAEVIKGLSPAEKYQLGIQAGQTLNKIHQIPAPSDRETWDEYFNRKIDRNINRYKNCGIKFEKAAKVIEYINEHRTLLVSRPQCLQHGDYHIGNMLVNSSGQLGIIDFNRLDFGDPWEEFNRFPWTASESTSFANGIIHGYFETEIPKVFLDLMALYIGSNLLGGFAWALEYGESEIQTISNQASEVMGWYSNFEKSTPNWFQAKSKPWAFE